MGVLDSLGVSNFFGKINFALLGRGVLIVVAFLLVAIIIGGAVFYYYSRKLKKQQFKNKIPIFMEINGKRTRITVDSAKELFVPDSNISLYYLKSKKIFMPRPTRAMAKNEYWYSISPNGEWVNFDLSVDPEQSTLAQANYDHRDTRYAYTNLKDIIKKNYKDKAIKWWKEYSHLISFIIIVFVMVLGMWILIAKMGKLIDVMSILVEKMTEFQKTVPVSSGVIQA